LLPLLPALTAFLASVVPSMIEKARHAFDIPKAFLLGSRLHYYLLFDVVAVRATVAAPIAQFESNDSR
jgi:hypothetical protein